MYCRRFERADDFPGNDSSQQPKQPHTGLTIACQWLERFRIEHKKKPRIQKKTQVVNGRRPPPHPTRDIAAGRRGDGRSAGLVALLEVVRVAGDHLQDAAEGLGDLDPARRHAPATVSGGVDPSSEKMCCAWKLSTNSAREKMQETFPREKNFPGMDVHRLHHCV